MFHRIPVVLGVALVASALAVVSATAAPTAAGAKRIVSLSPTATETLFAIGAGKQVVAVDDQSNFPANAPRTGLSGLKASAESLATYSPDLVVIQYDPGGLVKGLRALHIPVLVQPSATSLADAYGQIEQLGAAAGRRQQAAALVGSMKRRIAAAVAAAHGAGRGLKVYYELDNTYYSATSRTFVGQILRLLGLRDIADAADKSGSGYPQLSAEYVLSANPSVVILADTKCCGQSAATVAKRPGWRAIAAVKRGAVIGLNDDIASRWGPRTVDLVQAIERRLVALARRP